jgi:hypothetical protein
MLMNKPFTLAHHRSLQPRSQALRRLRRFVDLDTARVMQGMDAVRGDVDVASHKMTKIAQKGTGTAGDADGAGDEGGGPMSPTSPTSPESGGGGDHGEGSHRLMKMALDLQALESSAQGSVDLCESRAKAVAASSEKIEVACNELRTVTSDMVARATAAGMPDPEREFLEAKCACELHEARLSCKRALETAAEIETIREGHQKNVDAIHNLFSSVFGVVSQMERERVVKVRTVLLSAFVRRRMCSLCLLCCSLCTLHSEVKTQSTNL